MLGKGASLWGREQAFGGEWVVGSAGLTHFPRSRSRVRVLLYIRPPCPRREIAAMGTKDAPCEHPSPANTSAFAPSAFTLPRRRSHFLRMAFGLPPNDVRPCRAVVCTSAPAFTLPPHTLRRRPRRLRPPAAVVIHNGLSTEKLSTSLLAALCKTFSPRACARVYIIYRSSVGRSRECPRRCGEEVAPLWPRVPRRRAQGGEGRRQRRTPPRAATRTCPHTAPHFPCLRPNHCAQWRKCTRQSSPLLVRSPRESLSTAVPPPADGRSAVRFPRGSLPTTAPLPADGRSAVRRVGEGEGKGGRPLAQQPAPVRLPPRPCPPKWEPRLRRREGKRPNGAPPHRNAHTPNAERKRYLHNSRTKTQRRTKRCAQFVFFVFTPCKLLHNFSTVLHRSPRNVPKRAQMAARRPDFPCFTARFPPLSPESHCAKHPRTAPVLPPKNAPLRAYAKPRPHSRVRGTRQHATTCAFFTFSARYERVGGTRNANFCPAEGRKWGRFRSQMLKNGLQTKKSTFSFGRLVI